MQGMPIGEVARKSGVSASAIRYYEAEGLVDAPARASGWRAYDEAIVGRLQLIRIARELGFSLLDIRTLLGGLSTNEPPSARWHEVAQRKLPELNALLDQATAMKRLLEKGLNCNCVTIEECILFDCNPPVGLRRAPPSSSAESTRIHDP